MSNILEISHLTKKYGSKTVLDNMEFSIERGKVVGVLGRNGSGKTTLFKILSGLTRYNDGTIQISGNDVGMITKGVVSFMPDIPDLEGWSRVRDAIHKEFYNDYNDDKMNKLLDWMELSRTEKIGSLSRGTKEKLQLALTLSRNAELYILDEPITGVDPVVRDRIIDAIVQFYCDGSSVLISTHFISQLERLFDEVIVLKDQKIAFHKSADEIRDETGISLEQWAKEVI
jgi:ABC-2 type transport system ATP-binding protein